MSTKLLAVVAVGVAAVVAAGSGAYLAVRHNQAEATLAAPEASGTGAVSETEEIVAPETAKTPATEPAIVPTSQPRSVAKPAPAVSNRTTGVVTSRSNQPSSSSATGARVETASAPRRDERPTPVVAEGPQEPPALEARAPEAVVAAVPDIAPEPPAPQFEEIVIPPDAVIGLQVENSVSSETARIEDRVDARVTRDVRAGGAVAIPAGSRVQGSVTLVERGGKVKERARLGVRFHTVVLADGTRVPIRTETILREGESPVNGSASKIGGAAVGGAIIGAILGGGKGAAIGGSIGAAGGTAAVMAGGAKPATLNAGTTVTVHLAESAAVTVER